MIHSAYQQSVELMAAVCVCSTGSVICLPRAIQSRGFAWTLLPVQENARNDRSGTTWPGELPFKSCTCHQNNSDQRSAFQQNSNVRTSKAILAVGFTNELMSAALYDERLNYLCI